jgi:hypothetical protein
MSTCNVDLPSDAVILLARGGSGGSGGPGTTKTLSQPTFGGRSAAGAAGGTIDATVGPGTQLTAGESLVFLNAGGGAGGAGGVAAGIGGNSIGAKVADGSAGGGGGNATLVFQGHPPRLEETGEVRPAVLTCFGR